MATSITIKYTDLAMKKYQKAVPNVSASATDADLYNFATGLIALSTYMFESAQKVTTTNLAAHSGGGSGE